MRKQFAQTMLATGADERLVILIGDISHFLLREFEAQYPKRFYNMGVAEQSMMSMASGLALNGMYPVVHTIAPFITERCLEQIKDDLCYQKAGVNIVSIGAAFDYAALGCTHHCYDDVAILRAQPNMQVIVPGAAHEFDALFKETYANGMPTYFRLSEHEHKIPTKPRFGEVERLREGNDVTLVVTGPQLQNAYDAAEALPLSVDLLYAPTIKPISEASQALIRASIKKTKRLVTVEEHTVVGGLGDAIAHIAADEHFVHRRVGIQDTFLTNYGDYHDHCRATGLTKEGIMDAVQQIMAVQS